MKMLLVIAGVSSSGYYSWSSRRDRQSFDYEAYLAIKEIFLNHRGKYGARRIYMELTRLNNHMSLGKIRRIMKKHDLRTKVRRARPYRLLPQVSEIQTYENILNRNFHPTTQRKFFCTDITYIPWNGTFVYLSSIKDISTGEIVAWKCSLDIDIQLVLNTLRHLERNMLTHVWSLKGALIHSDRGSHYTGPQWKNATDRLGLVRSMSRVGRCIDNAPKESFFGHFKDEVSFDDCKTYDEVCLLVDQYMRYYNNDRPQWTKKKMTPVEYGNHLLSLP
jgi:putative transposase